MRTLDIFSEQLLIPRCDESLPPAEQSKVYYKLLTAEQEAFVRDMSRSLGNATACIAIWDLAVTRLENTVNVKGEPLVLARDTTARKVDGTTQPWNRTVLDQIPGAERDEIAGRILLAGNKAQEAEAKNS